MGLGMTSGLFIEQPWYYSYIPAALKKDEVKIKILHDEGDVDEITNQNAISEKKQGLFLVHPESSYRLVWDIITAFFVLVLIWLVPMYIGFTTWETPKSLKVLGYGE